MAKIYSVENQPGMFGFYCPGCKMDHGFTIAHPDMDHKIKWVWNGSFDAPTVRDSIRVVYPWGDPPVQMLCHLYLDDGFIRFLDDCTHGLKGQIIPMNEVE